MTRSPNRRTVGGIEAPFGEATGDLARNSRIDWRRAVQLQEEEVYQGDGGELQIERNDRHAGHSLSRDDGP